MGIIECVGCGKNNIFHIIKLSEMLALTWQINGSRLFWEWENYGSLLLI